MIRLVIGSAQKTLLLSLTAGGFLGIATVGCQSASQEKTGATAASQPTSSTQSTEDTIELPPGDGPVAKVNGVGIPREAFNREYIQTIDRYKRARQDVKPPLRERIKDNIVRKLVDQAIIAQKSEELGVTVDKETLDSRWAEQRKRYGSPEAFKAFVERAGTTEEDVRRNFDNNLLRQALFTRIAESVSINGAEVLEFFNKNRERYNEPEKVRASHILIRVPADAKPEVVKEKKKLAQSVRKKALKKGADFGEIAEEYGEDPTKQRGGDLGFFPRGRMVKPFEEAVWSLKTGQVSKVVRTQFGFHIIKKTDFAKATTKKFEEVSEQLEKGLLARKRNQTIRETLEKWKNEAEIELILKGDPAILNAAAASSTKQNSPIPGLKPSSPKPAPKPADR